ncbi:MAG: chromosomal replication initiator protein DnaA [Rhizobiales bacterium]|nr:chromosomal replication initiator protein DnaA [Hyphomicrobiales bacterium]
MASDSKTPGEGLPDDKDLGQAAPSGREETGTPIEIDRIRAPRISRPVSDVAASSGGDVTGEPFMRALARIKAAVGDENFISWFAQLQFEGRTGSELELSHATRFLKNWIERNYMRLLLDCFSAEYEGVRSVSLSIRVPGRAVKVQARSGDDERDDERGTSAPRSHARTSAPVEHADLPSSHTEINGFHGSPLDPRLTFDSFVEGAPNRLAFAAARQVAETLKEQPLRYNPLFIHSNVGLGKTHLLHAIAWDVKRRYPGVRALYLTAERFRYSFVEALRNQRATSFKETIRNIEILLIDDMEFLQGERTELEFDHTLNALLDSGRQVVVASANAPGLLEGLDPRMRSRLSGGLVTELGSLDYDLRCRVLRRRATEKQAADPTFQLSREVIEFLASELNESARELEGAVTRLYAACHLTGLPINVETTREAIRDLMQGPEQKRIKIEDILKLVSRHYGVSRTDILSQRRHRSVVRPRQVAMYLAKQLTSRSLPEIGRRIGLRDHTTVLHAVRKIDAEIKVDMRLKDEIDELKRFLNS